MPVDAGQPLTHKLVERSPTSPAEQSLASTHFLLSPNVVELQRNTHLLLSSSWAKYKGGQPCKSCKHSLLAPFGKSTGL